MTLALGILDDKLNGAPSECERMKRKNPTAGPVLSEIAVSVNWSENHDT